MTYAIIIYQHWLSAEMLLSLVVLELCLQCHIVLQGMAAVPGGPADGGGSGDYALLAASRAAALSGTAAVAAMVKAAGTPCYEGLQC